jgi:hypothetical protein
MILGAAHTMAITSHARLLAGVLAGLFILTILELIRRHKLRERYTILCLGAGVLVVAIAIFPGLLDIPNGLLGVRTSGLGLVLLLLLAFGAILLHLIVVVSRQSEQITRLAQELAMESSLRQQPSEEAGPQSQPANG